jgi:uncharacterized protein (TIGR00369 family)
LNGLDGMDIQRSMEKLAPRKGTFRGCFGCGVSNPRGLHLEFSRDGERGVVAYTKPESDLAGYRGFVHGGVIAAMLDEAMGWALLHVGGRYGVTRSMTIDYRRPARIGRELHVRAHIESVHARTAIMLATLRDARGRILAKAEGEWALVRNERAA